MAESAFEPQTTCAHFDPKLYISRQAGGWTDDDWVEWAAQIEPTKRLRSVIGPPGIGKSWFLCHLRQLFQAQNIPTLFIEARNFTAEGLFHWLEKEIARFKSLEFLKEVYTPATNPLAMWPEFIDALCEEEQRPIILFVDGFDEIGDDSLQSRLEREFIEPFLHIGSNSFGERRLSQSSMRVIIARRANQVLSTSYLKWEDEVRRLAPLEPREAQQQIERQASVMAEQIKGLDLSQRLHQVELSGNPFINNLLLTGEIGTRADISQQLRQVYLQRVGLDGPEHEQLLDTMQRMATLSLEGWDPASWTSLDYRNLLRHEKVSLKFDELKPAFTAGIVQYREGTGRYSLDPDFVTLSRRLLVLD